MDAEAFFHLGSTLIGGAGLYTGYRSSKTSHARFQSLYGATPLVCSIAWSLMVSTTVDLDRYFQPKHLLWCLLFFKSYLSENMLAFLLGADQKTLRKWIWYTVDVLNDLLDDLIRWEERHGSRSSFRRYSSSRVEWSLSSFPRGHSLHFKKSIHITGGF
mmetsp:Transcript_33490/g.69719  ORF Transcript_33490/g.69719 Transcript_33490/m.69719 type:complete len:159 (-) Transcript_33490:455-931(-)